MHLSENDYWRDAIMMTIADKVDSLNIIEALLLADNGEQFNADIWASAKLKEIGERA